MVSSLLSGSNLSHHPIESVENAVVGTERLIPVLVLDGLIEAIDLSEEVVLLLLGCVAVGCLLRQIIQILAKAAGLLANLVTALIPVRTLQPSPEILQSPPGVLHPRSHITEGSPLLHLAAPPSTLLLLFSPPANLLLLLLPLEKLSPLLISDHSRRGNERQTRGDTAQDLSPVSLCARSHHEGPPRLWRSNAAPQAQWGSNQSNARHVEK